MSNTSVPNVELKRTINVLRFASHPHASPHADQLEALMASGEQPYLDPRNEKPTYSFDGESWQNEGLAELLKSHEGLQAGDVIFRGTIAHQDPASFVDPQTVIESMNENAHGSEAGEWVNGWPEVDDQATAELEKLLNEWARRHCVPDFFLVNDSAEYTLTDEDILLRTTDDAIDAGARLDVDVGGPLEVCESN